MLGTLTLVLTALVAWTLYSPLRMQGEGDVDSAMRPETERLYEPKERCLQILKDLELDYATQKLSEHDYQTMKNEVAADLGGILEQLDAARGT